MSAAEANPRGWYDVLARQPSCEVHDDWVVTDIPFALCNSVLFPRWPDDEADERVGEIVAAGRERGVPQLWWLGETSTPVAGRLRAHGADVRIEELPAMELDLATLPVADPEVAPTGDPALLEEPFCSAFGIPDDAWASLRAAFAASAPALHHCVVRDGDRSLAAATALVHAGVAGLYNVSVVPDLRGRGLGAAVSVAALTAARDRAGAAVGVLHATPEGRPLYERLGFREVGRVWAVAAVML